MKKTFYQIMIAVFKIIEEQLSIISDRTILVGGDFNTVINIDMDKKNGRSDRHKNCRIKIKKPIRKL